METQDSRKSKELAVRDLKEPENMGKASQSGTLWKSRISLHSGSDIHTALAFAMVLLYIAA